MNGRQSGNPHSKLTLSPVDKLLLHTRSNLFDKRTEIMSITFKAIQQIRPERRDTTLVYVLQLAHEEGREGRIDGFDKFKSLAAVDALMVSRCILVEFACTIRPVSFRA